MNEQSIVTPSKSSSIRVLEINNISKSFPGVKALSNVSIEVYKGEILAILGENGAGKSTLMKIISGLYQPDTGEIKVNQEWFKNKNFDREVLTHRKLSNPRDAMKLGIGMVYQHFQLVDPFTVAENITLGKEFTINFQFGFLGNQKISSTILNNKLASQEIKKLGKNYGLPIDPDAIVADLPVGLRQRVEILKQLYRDAELLILDEPTAVLTPAEVKELFKTMKMLKDAGKSLIFISHKLREPLAIADRIIVLRQGEVVGEIKPDKANIEILAEMVVGRKILQQLNRKKLSLEEIVLDVQNLSIHNPISQDLSVKNASFKIYKNQIVGIAGVQGNGQTELVEAIIGLRKINKGSIKFIDQTGKSIEFAGKSTLDILNSGVAYIPEDRTTQGLILDFQITENVWLGFHGTEEQDNNSDTKDPKNKNKFAYWLDIAKSKLMLPLIAMEKLATVVVDQFEVMTVSVYSRIRNLSGGNQQKVLLGREFAKHPKLIVASQPTRGVDIGVMEKVHQELINRRNEGAAILLVSSDLDEVLQLSDYLLIMYEGEIAGQGNIDDLSITQISKLMTAGSDSNLVKQEVISQ